MKIDVLRFSAFYGGSGEHYQPLSDCWTYIDNVVAWMPNNDPITGNKIHDPSLVLPMPKVITDRKVYYDKLITTPGTLSNTEYGKTYSSCIDETFWHQNSDQCRGTQRCT